MSLTKVNWVTSFLLTFYAVIAGWVTAYIARALSGALSGLDAASANALLAGLHAAPGEMIAHQILFLAIIGLILIRELSAGLERANLVMIPLLIVMLIGIALYGAMAGDFGRLWPALAQFWLVLGRPIIAQTDKG